MGGWVAAGAGASTRRSGQPERLWRAQEQAQAAAQAGAQRTDSVVPPADLSVLAY